MILKKADDKTCKITQLAKNKEGTKGTILCNVFQKNV